jgi:large subunit ribosomal protein L25
MAGERVKLIVHERTKLGSAESRRLRKQGLIPGVLYGREEPTAISVEERTLRAALTTDAGLHAILDVMIEDKGRSHASVLKDYQQHPVRGGITHIDLQEVRLDQPIQSTVTLQLVGEAIGSTEGGVLNQSLNELQVEALPLEMPSSIEFDISGLHVGDSVRVSDIADQATGVTILDDPETVIASVTQPTRVETPGELLEGEEAAASAGGAAPQQQQPEGASEAPLEPDADAAGDEQNAPG